VRGVRSPAHAVHASTLCATTAMCKAPRHTGVCICSVSSTPAKLGTHVTGAHRWRCRAILTSATCRRKHFGCSCVLLC
jgi:hypothetical protein